MRVAALGADSRDAGTSHNNLGGLLMETGDDKGAAAHLEAALHIYEHVLGSDQADLAIPLSTLGALATRRGAHALRPRNGAHRARPRPHARDPGARWRRDGRSAA